MFLCIEKSRLFRSFLCFDTLVYGQRDVEQH